MEQERENGQGARKKERVCAQRLRPPLGGRRRRLRAAVCALQGLLSPPHCYSDHSDLFGEVFRSPWRWQATSTRVGSPLSSAYTRIDGARLSEPSRYPPHPTPHTLHPTPYTLHPTPYTLGAGARGVPALLGLALAAWAGVAAGLDACPAAGGANVSPPPPFRCAVATTCTVLAVRSGYAHSCALLSHGGVRCAPVPPCVEHNAPRLRLSVPCSL